MRSDTIRSMQGCTDMGKVMDPFYNKVCTIWNRSVDGLMETETWYPTVIENVRILVSRGNNIQASGNSSADSCRLHISDWYSEASKPFLPPEQWSHLVQSEKSNFYTLEDKDSFFTEGDTSNISYINKKQFFQWMKQNARNCFKISSVDRFEIVPHWEVWGK